MQAASNEEGDRRSIDRWLPGVALARRYDRSWLSADILTGVTVCAILILQGMAYGELAAPRDRPLRGDWGDGALCAGNNDTGGDGRP